MIHKEKPLNKTVVILQSCYVPWKGYFDLINMADEFIIYDDVQYTRSDWRNRNQIKTPQGLQWLTVPVEIKDHFHHTIDQAIVSDKEWGKKHWRALQRNYARAPFFKDYAAVLEPLFLDNSACALSEINVTFLKTLCRLLGIQTPLVASKDYNAQGQKNDRLLDILKKSGATHYISGPAAQSYLDEDLFRQSGIEVQWMDYSGYPEYPQLWGDFVHGVTILDLLFNVGQDAPKFMKSFAL